MRRYSGWTLKETLIAVGVIVLLVALLFPVVQVVRYRAYETKCRANLWNIMLVYDELKNKGYRGEELRKKILNFIADNPEIGRCPMTGVGYVSLSILSQHQVGEDIWMDNPQVVVSCSCHTDPKKRYVVEENCTRIIRHDGALDTWFLSGVDRNGELSVEYAPDIVKIKRPVSEINP